MSLSKRSQKTNSDPITFSVAALAVDIENNCPDVVFALLMGSSSTGTIGSGSDLDIAVYLGRDKTSDDFYHLIESIENSVPGADVDLGFLYRAEPVYRFEALKGELLFTRDEEAWLHFYSLTCREYEHWMGHYEKQRRYRIEYAGPR